MDGPKVNFPILVIAGLAEPGGTPNISTTFGDPKTTEQT